MEVKKYNPFVVNMPKPKPRVKVKAKPKPQTKLEARGLALENKKKLEIFFMLRVLLRLVGNNYKDYSYNYNSDLFTTMNYN